MKIPRWAQVLIGVGIVMVFLAIGGIIVATSFFAENVVIADSSARDADEAFEQVRQRFKGQPPLVEWSAGVSRRMRELPPESAPRANLQTLHILAWDDRESRLVTVTVPWWLVRMKSGPIRFSTYAAGLDDEGVRLRPEEIERLGPGIILEGTGPRGERVMLWTD